MRFIGRKQELQILENLLKKQTSSLAVLWGRRRIGKSTLVAQFLKNRKAWSFSGLPPTAHTTAQQEIDHFANQLTRNTSMPKLSTPHWSEIFWHLGNLAEKQDQLIIFFDEISWMGSQDPHFLGHLKTEWDRSLSQHPRLILILCGSISNWIEQNILSSTGFLGRISIKLEIKELPLEDCHLFWHDQKNRISAYEKLKILSVTGGVPKYLEEILPQESAEKNITRLCFKPEGLLFREYDQIFSDLFSKRAATFDKIIRALVSGAKTLDQICEILDVEKSGNTSGYLHELVATGFVSEDATWNIREKLTSNLKTFRLKDNYLRFYLKFIEPHKAKIEQFGLSSQPLNLLAGWEIILGLQFENLVLNNLLKLCELIGLSLHEIEKAGPFFQKKTALQKGCQIDLLIQTRFNTLYLCEIKFYAQSVGSEIIDQVQEKINRLSYPKGYSIRPILIHVNGVTSQVRERGVFDKIIDFSDFFNK